MITFKLTDKMSLEGDSNIVICCQNKETSEIILFIEANVE